MNFLWFVISVAVYTVVWYLWKKPKFDQLLKHIGIIALLCIPFNISDVIITPLGSGEGKHIYSLFSLYQKAERNAFSAFGGIYQKADNDAVVLIGLSGYQKAGSRLAVGIGFAGYQESDNDAWTIVGLSGYQKADNKAMIMAGLAFYQTVPGKSRWFGVFTKLEKE